MNAGKIGLGACAVIFACGLAACGKHGTTQNAATETNKAVPPVPEVSAPRPKASAAPEDLAVSAKVSAAFQQDPALKLLEINVDTTGGVVTLTGPINTQANSDKAAQVAGAVPGVKSVDNRLSVKAPG